MQPQQGTAPDYPKTSSSPSTASHSREQSRRGQFGHKSLSPASRSQIEYLQQTPLSRSSKTARYSPAKRLQERRPLISSSTKSSPVTLAHLHAVSASEQKQTKPLATWEIAEIALMLSKTMKSTDIEKLLESLALNVASRQSLKQAYRADQPLWLFSGIKEAIDKGKISSSPVRQLSQVLGTLGMSDLAVKITDMTNQPVETLPQQSVCLNDLLTSENKSKVASTLKQPLLVGLLSGLSSELIFQIRMCQGSTSYSAQQVLFFLEERAGSQNASNFFQALKQTGNLDALRVLGQHSESETTEHFSAAEDQPDSPSEPICFSGSDILSPDSFAVTAGESVVIRSSAPEPVMTAKNHAFNHDELMLIIAENYQSSEKQKRHTPWVDPNRRADFIKFSAQFSGLTSESLEWNERTDSGYGKAKYQERYQQKQLACLKQISTSTEVNTLMTKKGLKMKEALVFFAMKANAMDLAARMCQVMCPGQEHQASAVYFNIKSMVKRHQPYAR